MRAFRQPPYAVARPDQPPQAWGNQDRRSRRRAGQRRDLNKCTSQGDAPWCFGALALSLFMANVIWGRSGPWKGHLRGARTLIRLATRPSVPSRRHDILGGLIHEYEVAA